MAHLLGVNRGADCYLCELGIGCRTMSSLYTGPLLQSVAPPQSDTPPNKKGDKQAVARAWTVRGDQALGIPTPSSAIKLVTPRHTAIATQRQLQSNRFVQRVLFVSVYMLYKSYYVSKDLIYRRPVAKSIMYNCVKGQGGINLQRVVAGAGSRHA